MVLACPIAAHAQSDDARTDLSISSAQDLADATETGARVGQGAQILEAFKPPPLSPGTGVFWGAVDFMTAYNSNPPLSAGSVKNSAQFNTKLQLNYHHQFQGVKFRWAGTVEIDRYDAFSSANQDNIINTLRLDFNGVRTANPDAEPSKPKPVFGYVFYTPTIRQKDDFEGHKATLHDLGGGVSMSNPFNVSAPWSFGLDSELTRRLSDQSGNSISGMARARIQRKLNDNLFVKFEPSLRHRSFDETLGVRRRDTTLVVPLAFSWDPRLLEGNRSQIVFGMTASKTWSNVPAKRNRQWILGPTIQLVQPFS